MRPIRPAVLSLGSNVGDRVANLQGAVEAMADTMLRLLNREPAA